MRGTHRLRQRAACWLATRGPPRACGSWRPPSQSPAPPMKGPRRATAAFPTERSTHDKPEALMHEGAELASARVLVALHPVDASRKSALTKSLGAVQNMWLLTTSVPFDRCPARFTASARALGSECAVSAAIWDATSLCIESEMNRGSPLTCRQTCFHTPLQTFFHTPLQTCFDTGAPHRYYPVHSHSPPQRLKSVVAGRRVDLIRELLSDEKVCEH